MSIKKLYSNELLASFEYSNIDKDYDFYYVTTSDKYIKGGATFLDIDDIKINYRVMLEELYNKAGLF